MKFKFNKSINFVGYKGFFSTNALRNLAANQVEKDHFKLYVKIC
jgi:hypothetical protein